MCSRDPKKFYRNLREEMERVPAIIVGSICLLGTLVVAWAILLWEVARVQP